MATTTPVNASATYKQQIATISGIFNSAHYASIQAAVDAAEVAGGTVYIPPGTHTVASEITIDSSNVAVFIDSGATLEAGAGSMAVILVDGTAAQVSNVQIYGGGLIDGNGQTSLDGVKFHGDVVNCQVRDIEITDVSNDGIRTLASGADRPNNCTFVNLYIHDAEEGFLIEGSDQIQVIGCRVVNTNGDCYEPSASTLVTFFGCMAKNPGGINAGYDVHKECEDISFFGCTAFMDDSSNNSGTKGFSASQGSGSAAPKRVLISGCTVRGEVTSSQGASGADTKSFDRGIEIAAGCSEFNIVGNNIYGCCYDQQSYGVHISDSSFNFSNNRVERTGTASMYLLNSTHLTISGNTFTDSHWDTDATDQGVINLVGSAPDVWAVNNNHFENNNGTLDAFYYINTGYSGASDGGLISGNTSDGGLASGGSGLPVNINKSDIKNANNLWLGQNRTQFWLADNRLASAVESVEVAQADLTLYLQRATGNTCTLPQKSEIYPGWTVRLVVDTAPTSGDYIITEDGTADTNQVNSVVWQPGTYDADGNPVIAAAISATGHTFVNFKSGVALVGDYIDVTYGWNSKFIVTGHVQATGGITLT